MTQEKTTTIIIYTHPDCNYSDVQREEFVKGGVEFTEIDVNLHPEAIDDLVKLTGGERITPVVVEGDTVTVGYHGVG